jgi:membrane protein implicated in regulation of membrane protease activity
MSQGRRLSMIEAGTNVVVGYLLALATQLAVFPAVGVSVTLQDNLRISAAFVAVSLARSYLLRRIFNRVGTAKHAGQDR